jgi:hypothetical protein
MARPKLPGKWVVLGPKGVKSGSEIFVSKSDPGTFGMLRQVFLGHFEPTVTRFGPWNVLGCLENWPFWDQKRAKGQ